MLNPTVNVMPLQPLNLSILLMNKILHQSNFIKAKQTKEKSREIKLLTWLMFQLLCLFIHVHTNCDLTWVVCARRPWKAGHGATGMLSPAKPSDRQWERRQGSVNAPYPPPSSSAGDINPSSPSLSTSHSASLRFLVKRLLCPLRPGFCWLHRWSRDDALSAEPWTYTGG